MTYGGDHDDDKYCTTRRYHVWPTRLEEKLSVDYIRAYLGSPQSQKGNFLVTRVNDSIDYINSLPPRDQFLQHALRWT